MNIQGDVVGHGRSEPVAADGQGNENPTAGPGSGAQ